MLFKSVEEFKKEAAEITLEMKKKDKTRCQAFVIKPSSKVVWDRATIEAVALMSIPIEDRSRMFQPLPVVKNDLDKIVKDQNLLKRKRRHATSLNKQEPNVSKIVSC